MEAVWVLPPSIRPFFALIGLTWGLVRLKPVLLALSAIWAILACFKYLATGSVMTVFALHMLTALSTSMIISVPVCLAAWVPSQKLGTRIGIFMSMIPLTTSFLSLPISEIVHLFNQYWKHEWRLIYLFSGIPPLIAFLGILVTVPSNLPAAPIFIASTTRHKNYERNSWAGLLLRAGKVVIDPKNSLLALAFWAVNMTFAPNPCLYGTKLDLTFTYIPRFLYFISSDLGNSFDTFHMYVFAPYAVAAAVTVASTRASDRTGTRSRYILVHAMIAAASFAIMAITGTLHHTPWVLYLASFPVTSAYFSLTSLIITWAMNNEVTTFNRMVVISLFAIFGELGTQLSPNGVYPYFRTPQEWTDPLQIRVHLIDIAMMLLVIVISYWLRYHLSRENRKLKKIRQQLAEDETMFFEYVL